MNTTLYVVSGSAIALIGYDVYTAIKRGNESTISYQLWTISQKYPVVALAFGILMGHFFWGQK